MTKSQHPAKGAAGERRLSDAVGSRVSPRDGGNSLGQSAPLSNTALSNCIQNPNSTQVLRTGVDSLYLSYRGILYPDREAALEQMKGLAQSDDQILQAEAVLPLSDHRFEVKDKGKGRFPFVLVDNWFHIQVSRTIATRLPMIYAQISSEILSRSGIQPSVIAINGVALALGEWDGKQSVSRVDLCADFCTDIDLEALPRLAWVTRAEKYTAYHDKGKFTGFTFGEGGQLMARLYDKTLEIEKSEKYFFLPIWQNAGWDGQRPVWRMEFQFSRSVLRELGITSTDDLINNLAGMWLYATTAWLRLTVPSISDDTTSRWPNHPLWDSLTQAIWGRGPCEPLYRSRKERTPSPRFLFVNGIGAITSLMGQEGITNFDEGLRRFGEQAHSYHLEQSRRTGKTLNTYAREKATAKARRFNTTVKPTTLITPEQYRKAKERR